MGIFDSTVPTDGLISVVVRPPTTLSSSSSASTWSSSEIFLGKIFDYRFMGVVCFGDGNRSFRGCRSKPSHTRTLLNIA